MPRILLMLLMLMLLMLMLLTQAGRDLNPQPLVLETSALPIELPT